MKDNTGDKKEWKYKTFLEIVPVWQKDKEGNYQKKVGNKC